MGMPRHLPWGREFYTAWKLPSALYKLPLVPYRFSSRPWLEFGSFGHVNTKRLPTETQIKYIHVYINTMTHLDSEISQKHIN